MRQETQKQKEKEKREISFLLSVSNRPEMVDLKSALNEKKKI